MGRRTNPRTLPLVLFGGTLLLSFLGVGAAVASFLLLRAGYGVLVWGVLPFLALLLVAVAVCGILLRIVRGALRPAPGKEEEPGPRRGDDV